MKILYVSQYYPPEMGAPPARVSQLARRWVEAGHEVTVLTGFPNHPTGKVPAAYRGRLWRLVTREEIDGVKVIRTWLWPLPNRKSHERIRNYASFCVSAALTGSFVGRPDVVLATSPQLLVGISGWWISRIKRVPLVLEVRDLWPESLEAVGVSTQRSALFRTLRRVAGFLYRKAQHIAVVTPAFQEHLEREWQLPAQKLSVMENGVDTDLFAPGKAGSTRDSLGLQRKFVISYVGTMGNAHGLTTLLDAAERLRTALGEAMFLLIGEGAEKEQLMEAARQRGLDNVRFLDQQPREQIPSLLAASDLCVVLLKDTPVFKTVIPTKMLEMMSCGRPVLLGVDGQARELLERAGGGVAIPPGNSEELARTIRRLHDDAALRTRLGESGRAYALRALSWAPIAQNYVSLLERVARARRSD